MCGASRRLSTACLHRVLLSVQRCTSLHRTPQFSFSRMVACFDLGMVLPHSATNQRCAEPQPQPQIRLQPIALHMPDQTATRTPPLLKVLTLPAILPLNHPPYDLNSQSYPSNHPPYDLNSNLVSSPRHLTPTPHLTPGPAGGRRVARAGVEVLVAPVRVRPQ